MAGSITGLDDVLHRIETMRLNAQKKYARKASRQAMNIARDAARSNAKNIDDPATEMQRIFKNIVVQSGKTSDKNTVRTRVGIKGGAYAHNKENVRSGRAGQETANIGNASNPGGDTFYWRFVEFGTSKVAAVPFMRPALADNTQAVTDKFAQVFREGILQDLGS